MSEREPIERWRDRNGGDTPEARAGALFRSVRPTEPSPELAERVQATLRGEAKPFRLGRPIPALATMLVFLAIAGGATAGTMIYKSWIAPPPEEPPVPAKRVRVKRSVPPPEPVIPPPPVAETPVIEAPPPAAPEPKKRPRAPSSLALESQRIKAAVDALRAGDAARALEEIGRYEQAHPGGLLQREALLAKISAMVTLDRETEALAILDGTVLDAQPRSLELTVLRGELLVGAHRCEEARADFERALAGELGEALRRRAENGLARCKEHSVKDRPGSQH